MCATAALSAAVACGAAEAVDEHSAVVEAPHLAEPIAEAKVESDLSELLTLTGPLAEELGLSMSYPVGDASETPSPFGFQSPATISSAAGITPAQGPVSIAGAAKLASVMIGARQTPLPTTANALSTPPFGGPAPAAPAALSAAAIWADEGDVVTFSGSFVDPGVLDTHSIRWNFGDGVETMNVLVPTHINKDNGNYKVTLDVTDKDGDVGTASMDVLIDNLPPTANLGPARLISEGELTTFDAAVSDPGKEDTHTYKWYFEPGANPVDGSGIMTYSYADEGVFSISVTVVDDDGGSTTSNVTVHVLNEPPAVQAGADQTADEGSLISFVGTFLDSGVQDVHNTTWDFGDGTVVGGTLIPTHVYLDDGTYSVTLTVTDGDGGSGSDTLQVKVIAGQGHQQAAGRANRAVVHNNCAHGAGVERHSCFGASSL
ncbi:MAG: PKD domain-containing protein [SAR202 cluster bacterium]|nr:PKD domain-containing protein [SAR202 cluster bacterium]